MTDKTGTWSDLTETPDLWSVQTQATDVWTLQGQATDVWTLLPPVSADMLTDERGLPLTDQSGNYLYVEPAGA